jgi:hypothetical protein
VTRTRRSILFALPALLVVGPALLFAKGQQPEETNGGYKVTIAGYWTGTGTAVVRGGNGNGGNGNGGNGNGGNGNGGNGGTVSITAEVTDPKGNKSQFSANLQLKGAHFSGKGGANNEVDVTGRLDGYARKKSGPGRGKKDFQGARLLGSYSDGKNPGISGRIAGVWVDP